MKSGTPAALVSVLVTTYNSSLYLQRCLDSIKAQSYTPLEIVIVDNASRDGTREILDHQNLTAKVMYNDQNTGFAAAQNQAMRAAAGQWLLSLNPDVVLSPNFVEEMVAMGELDRCVGTVCGKLLRWHPGAEQEFSQTIDSTGIYFTRSLRHLDRGAEETDHGQYDRVEYVFGATGAAALYRRKMVEDVSVEGEFFDEQFFAYREDADLAWRAQLLGWKCLYTPKAVAWHVRRVTPERRSQLPTEINWHSIKNRFLMRAKNISWPLYVRFLLPITFRDAQVIGYCLLVNRKLASGLLSTWTSRHELLRKRRFIQSRRVVRDEELSRWFSEQPVSFPFSASTPGAGSSAMSPRSFQGDKAGGSFF
ncbi:MAG TPA: glycosyltransferase family 2 protein [Terriglobales bacterium]|nr:glycosyltransferase family 2 protein [Terriglobales bacterium]